MTTTFQSELQDWLNAFRSHEGLPKKSVTLTLVEQNLIVQYEPKAQMPAIARMRKAGTELAMASGVGAVVGGGVAMLVGRTLLGGMLARAGVAGAFGAVGLSMLGTAVTVGGTVAGVGYTVYQLGKNKAQNDQARAFGDALLAHLKAFRPLHHLRGLYSWRQAICLFFRPHFLLGSVAISNSKLLPPRRTGRDLNPHITIC